MPVDFPTDLERAMDAALGRLKRRKLVRYASRVGWEILEPAELP